MLAVSPWNLPIFLLSSAIAAAVIFLCAVSWKHKNTEKENIPAQTVLAPKDKVFLAELSKHMNEGVPKCYPVDIIRIGVVGKGGFAKGVINYYSDGWQFALTVAHVFEKKYGEKAQYEVKLNGQHLAWITSIVTPQDYDKKWTENLLPDIVACKLGDNPTTINSFTVTSGEQLNAGVVPVQRIMLHPLDRKLPLMPVDAICGRESKFPTFIARQASQRGESGSGYLDNNENLFLLSGSDGIFTFLVPASPIDISAKKQ